MFKQFISWRRNLFMLMLMQLFLYSHTAHSKLLCFGWQFENRHFSGKGFQVIARSVTVPVRNGYFQFLLKQISFEIGKKLIIYQYLRQLCTLIHNITIDNLIAKKH